MEMKMRKNIDKVKNFKQFVNEQNNILKGEYFVDSIDGETFDDSTFNSDEYGVFFTGSKELGKEGHCYFYGSKVEADEYAHRKNTHLKEQGYF